MTLEEKVKAIVTESLHRNAEEVKTDADFITDLAADSLDIAELMMAIEEEFKSYTDGESIPETDAEKIRSVGALVEYLKGKGVPETL